MAQHKVSDNQLPRTNVPGWSEHQISELGRVDAGRQRAPNAPGAPRPYLRVANVFDGQIDTADVFEMPFTDGEFARFKLQVGDILLNEGQSLELVGRCAVYRGDPPNAAFQNSLIRFRAGERITTEFAFQLFRHLQYSGVFSSVATQTTSIAHLGVSRFAALRVRVPPLPEQHKIAAILSSVDDTIEKTQAVIDQLGVVRKGLLGELLTRGIPGRHTDSIDTEIGLLPSGWRTKRLSDVADFINGRAFKPSDWSTEGIPIIRIQNLNGGMDFNYYTGEFDSRFALATGDLLFSWSGTRGTSFGPHIWNGPAGVLNQHIFSVRNLRDVSKLFLYYALKWVTTAVEQRAHGGTGIVHITKGQLESFVIPNPPPEEQEEIAERLHAVDKSHAKNMALLNGTQQLKAALLDALLSGALRISTQAQEAA